MRFQKRIKLFSGVSINLSKSGISTSIGPRGAKVTVGNGRQSTTIGIPGTGLSHTERRASTTSMLFVLALIVLIALVTVFS